MHCPHCGKPIDRQAAAFQRHRYPELEAVGLGHLWTGPGFNDFAEQVIRGAQKFLRKRDLPAERGDAINALRNKIRQADWGYLEQRFVEGAVPQPSPPAPLPGAEGGRSVPQVADPGAAPPLNTAEYWRWLATRRGDPWTT